jgi:hypothetical protein
VNATKETRPEPTPGYNCRLTIWFQTTRSGRPTAWYWSYGAFRAIRLPLADAELMRATDTADVIPGHPFRP